MSASLIDGKFLASLSLEKLKKEVDHQIHQGHRAPSLAVILIGTDPASSIYVHNKKKACAEVGIISQSYHLPDTTKEKDLIKLISELNASADIDGILVQLPLPQHINEALIIEHIKPQKDVDGFHPYNLGRLAQANPLLRPCTPLGIMRLLAYYQLPIKGKHAVVIGASKIVGRPMGLELLMAGATVTTCHRATQNLEQLIRIADYIIVAAGHIDVVDIAWLNKNQVIVDVGIHRLADGSIRGDVDFKKAMNKVAWITPVPGGVGPMTIVSLLENTLMASKKHIL